MSTTARPRVRLSHTQRYDAPVEQVFPLLCPVREHDYLPHWKADIVYLESGLAEQGGIFTTVADGGGRDVWVISRYEPPRRIQFVRVDALRVAVYDLHVEAAVDGGTRIRWEQQITSLSPDGDAGVRQHGQESFSAMHEALARHLEHYLATGRMLHPG